MSEVAVFIGDLGKSLNLTEGLALQRAIDTDGDGTVDLREFIRAWTPPVPAPVLRFRFHGYDQGPFTYTQCRYIRDGL